VTSPDGGIRWALNRLGPSSHTLFELVDMCGHSFFASYDMGDGKKNSIFYDSTRFPFFKNISS
jgi:hypothetical protein